MLNARLLRNISDQQARITRGSRMVIRSKYWLCVAGSLTQLNRNQLSDMMNCFPA